MRALELHLEDALRARVEREARALTGLPVVSEVVDPRQVERMAGAVDVLQVGARNMQNYALLAEVGWRPADAPLVYVCGPTAFVETVANALVGLGHDPRRIRTERFGGTGT